MLRTIRYIVLRISGRPIGCWVGINTEDGEIACLSRPHPVVRFTTELTHRLRNGENESQIGEILVNGGIETVALVEWVDRNTEGFIYFTHRVGEYRLQRVDKKILLSLAGRGISVGHQSRSNVLLRLHKAHKHVSVGQFFLVCLGIKAV